MVASERIKFQVPKKFVKYSILIVAALVFVTYIITATKFTFYDFLILIAFILIGAAARLPQRFAPVAVGVEIISLFTIVSAIKYGSLAGAVVGTAAFIISGYFTIERPQDILIAAIGFIGMAFFASISYAFFAHNLGLTAIALTLGYDVFTGAFYFFMGHNLVSIARFAVVHIIANYFIIGYLGAKLLGI